MCDEYTIEYPFSVEFRPLRLTISRGVNKLSSDGSVRVHLASGSVLKFDNIFNQNITGDRTLSHQYDARTYWHYLGKVCIFRPDFDYRKNGDTIYREWSEELAAEYLDNWLNTIADSVVLDYKRYLEVTKYWLPQGTRGTSHLGSAGGGVSRLSLSVDAGLSVEEWFDAIMQGSLPEISVRLEVLQLEVQ